MEKHTRTYIYTSFLTIFYAKKEQENIFAIDSVSKQIFILVPDCKEIQVQ
jgi:hypothetical protein